MMVAAISTAKTPLPGPGSSSPIVVGDRVFLTCYTGYGPAARGATSQDDLKLHVLCLNRADGRILWDKPIAAELPEQERVQALNQEGVRAFLRAHGDDHPLEQLDAFVLGQDARVDHLVVFGHAERPGLKVRQTFHGCSVAPAGGA